MEDKDILKLKEKIEDFICLQLADDMDDYEEILDKLVSLFMDGYKKLTIEQVREKFEKYIAENFNTTCIEKHPESVEFFGGLYVENVIQGRWQAYQQAYKDMGLIE